MTKRKQARGLRSWAVLGLAVALIVSACGTSGTEETTTSAATATTTAAPTTTVGPTTTAVAVALDPIPMRIGAITPQTGSLSGINASLEQALLLGVEEINAVSPDLVAIDFTDEADDETVVSTNVEQYLTGDHNAIIGPAASGMANAIWDKVNTAGMVMCSGSSTGAAFSSPDFNPNHVRTAPSDNIQAPVLGNLIVEDGFTNVAVVWRSDTYGEGFGVKLADTLAEAGATVPLREGYDPKLTSFTELAQSIVASGAEALAMIVFAEGGQLVLDLEQAGWEGSTYIADGFVDTVKPETLGGRTELVTGFKGTYPSAAPADGEPTFGDRFEAFSPGTPTIYSAHMYDCLATLLLAAQVAQSSDPAVYVDEIIGVTRDGEKCTLVADCLEKVWAGVDIDYDGASGPLEFTENGEPGLGTYDVLVFSGNATETGGLENENVDQIQGSE